MNRHRPARTMLRIAVGAIQIFTAPFVESGNLHAATRSLVAAQKIVQEDEFEFCATARQCFSEPVILGTTKRPSPAIAAAAGATNSDMDQARRTAHHPIG